ncbi:endonuclease/exonuclease/phosphatase family protein [Metabacillus idriensis]|nr:endonuclease/exonuclease/phosphatase family protein [Metabacillus idriensis]
MTFNIHHGRGMDKQLDLFRIAEVIEKSDADIIGLNEVYKYFSKRSGYEDQISWLAKQLNMNQTFCPSLSLTSKNSTNVRQYGNALLSRYPIVNEKRHLFNFIPGLIEGRSLLDSTIEIKKNYFKSM